MESTQCVFVAETQTVDVAFDTINGNAGPVINGQAGPVINGQAGPVINGQAAPDNPVREATDSDVIAEEIQRKKRDLSPLAYCRFITNRPKLAFGKISVSPRFRYSRKSI